VNKILYWVALASLHDAVKNDCWETWRNGSLLHQHNMPSYCPECTWISEKHDTCVVPNPSQPPDLNPCDCSLFSEPKLGHEGKKLTSTSLKTQIADQESFKNEMFYTYFHKYIVVYQIIQLQGGYLEDNFQHCGKTWTYMSQNQSWNFWEVLVTVHWCFTITGPSKYSKTC
jgi:hypothetical protein